jgi:hypothetical protein
VADVEDEAGAGERRDVEVDADEVEAGPEGEERHHESRHALSQHGRSLYSAESSEKDPVILKRLYELGEEALGRVAAALLANPRFADAFGRALQSAFATKTRVDRNIQNVLALLNLPSRGDVSRLLTKLEALQGSLVNLNLKVDRLLAASKPVRRRAPKKKAASTDEQRE